MKLVSSTQLPSDIESSSNTNQRSDFDLQTPLPIPKPPALAEHYDSGQPERTAPAKFILGVATALAAAAALTAGTVYMLNHIDETATAALRNVEPASVATTDASSIALDDITNTDDDVTDETKLEHVTVANIEDLPVVAPVVDGAEQNPEQNSGQSTEQPVPVIEEDGDEVGQDEHAELVPEQTTEEIPAEDIVEDYVEAVPEPEPAPAPVATPAPEPVKPGPLVVTPTTAQFRFEWNTTGWMPDNFESCSDLVIFAHWFDRYSWYCAHNWSYYGPLIADLNPGDLVKVDGIGWRVTDKFIITWPSKTDAVFAQIGSYNHTIFQTCCDSTGNDIWIVVADRI